MVKKNEKFGELIFREKGKKVWSVRLPIEDIEYLKSLSKPALFIHEAIEGRKRQERRVTEKIGAPHEIVPEIAEFYAKELEEEAEGDREVWETSMSETLNSVADLSLKNRDPEHPDRVYPPDFQKLLQRLKSKEAKDFVSKIQQTWEKASQGKIDFVEAVELPRETLNAVKMVIDEAKSLLEKRYRELFRRLPPEDWHLYVVRTELGIGKTGRKQYHVLSW